MVLSAAGSLVFQRFSRLSEDLSGFFSSRRISFLSVADVSAEELSTVEADRSAVVASSYF